jgi:hypothetical protein
MEQMHVSDVAIRTMTINTTLFKVVFSINQLGVLGGLFYCKNKWEMKDFLYG